MWGAWILLLMCVSLGECQDPQYVDYEYVDVVIPETNARTRHSSASVAPQLKPRNDLKPRRPGTAGAKKSNPRATTPIPIIKDIRRVDPNTGAFYYHYEGGDGSMKHEVRFPNGTVLGNYTFIKDNGELETRTYHYGMGSNIVDNDNGDYELHRHLEQPYVHQSGPDPVEQLFPEESFPQPNSVRIQSHRPIAQSRPVSRPRVRAHPRPITSQQVQTGFNAPQSVPLDYHDAQTAFSFQDESRLIFDPSTVNVAPIDHEAQGSSLYPVVESLPQSQDQQSVPVEVSEQ